MSTFNGGNIAITGGYSPTYSGGNLVVTGGTGSYWTTPTTYDTTISYNISGYQWPRPKKSIKLHMEEARKWAEDFCEKSPNYDKTLKGFSALASRDLYKRMVEDGYDDTQLLFGYIHNKLCSHVFLICNEQVLDVCADIFGCDYKKPAETKDIDIEETPWWDSSINYASQSGLIARQRRDGWPEWQVTLTAAKTKLLPKISFSPTEATDIEKMRFKLPLDDVAESYLKKQSKTGGFKTNLAALLLSSDPTIAKLAAELAEKALG